MQGHCQKINDAELRMVETDDERRIQLLEKHIRQHKDKLAETEGELASVRDEIKEYEKQVKSSTTERPGPCERRDSYSLPSYVQGEDDDGGHRTPFAGV